ncbi:MAG: metallopeptidase family protein [Chloroflexi bacterium]|nr:metallopeptidase family protein [Chloroflexota bacterium]
MTPDEFDLAVQQAWNELPRDLRRSITNVVIVVEDRADEETLDLAEIDDPMELYGFYHGIPLTARGNDYGLLLPDKISIYRDPIVAACVNDEEVRAFVRKTVRHEIAHYFGIDDERLEELDAY